MNKYKKYNRTTTNYRVVFQNSKLGDNSKNILMKKELQGTSAHQYLR